MVAIMDDQTLRQAYGGMPAATADQAAWFASMDNAEASIFPATTSIGRSCRKWRSTRPYRVTSPTCPISRRTSRITRFLHQAPELARLNLKAELLKLQATLQADYDCSGCIQSF